MPGFQDLFLSYTFISPTAVCSSTAPRKGPVQFKGGTTHSCGVQVFKNNVHPSLLRVTTPLGHQEQRLSLEMLLFAPIAERAADCNWDSAQDEPLEARGGKAASHFLLPGAKRLARDPAKSENLSPFQPLEWESELWLSSRGSQGWECRFTGCPEDELRPWQRPRAAGDDTAEQNLGKEKQGTANLLCGKGKSGEESWNKKVTFERKRDNSKVLKRLYMSEDLRLMRRQRDH